MLAALGSFVLVGLAVIGCACFALAFGLWLLGVDL